MESLDLGGGLRSKHTKCSSIDRYDQSCCPPRQLSVSEQGRLRTGEACPHVTHVPYIHSATRQS